MWLQSSEVAAVRTIVSETKSTPDRLHARLAHVSVDPIKSSAKHKVATGLDITPSIGADPPCVSCVGGKLARHTFPDKGSDAEEALAAVHIDLCGPFRVAAKDGSLFFLLLKDRHTRFVWMMLVTKKSDVLREFQKWLVLVERQAKKSVLMLRSDQGGEFLGKEFTDFVDSKGIVHNLTCPYTPQQNGMAEREMSTAVESVRTMLLHMGVQHHWWHLALRQAVLDLTDNKVVTSVEVIFYETLSLEVWKAKFGPASGRMQTHLPTDTSTATVPLLAEVDEPGDEDVVEASPVAPASGIAGGRQGAKLIDQDGKPSTTGEQQTGEQQTGEPVEQKAATGVQSTGEPPKSAGSEQLVEGSKQLVDDLTVDKEGELSAGEESTDSDVVEVPIMKPELRRTSRARRPSERLSFHACLPPAAFTAVYDEVDDDLLYDDAEEDEELPELDPDMHADPEHRWDIATMTVKDLVDMGTWELVECRRGVNIMKNRWVLTTKYRLDDTVEREKARLVVKGFAQVYGVDYDETYSPVSSYVTLRIFLSIVAILDLNLMQLDMKNAFLQSKLDRVLYMYQPDYFDDGTGRAGDIGVTFWVLVYVDDLLTASSSPAMLKELKELLEAAFELREILPVVKYLRLEIVRERPAKKLWLHQQGYADKLRRRFIDEEQGGRVLKTPVSVDAYAELTFDDEEAQEREEEEYQEKVGLLQFAVTSTRPDIAFACSKLGSGPTMRSDQHCREVDRCLAYLADTRDTALEFGGEPEMLELIGYVDADDAGDKQKRTSTSGYVFVYGGAAVSWLSSRIKCATLSSTESEYIVATNAGKEGRRLRFLLVEFKLLNAGKPTILHVDNRSAITVAAGLGLTGNLKHMERRHAWLQHMVMRGKLVLKYIPTTEQPAYFLTKALHFSAFNRCSVAIGQVRLVDIGDGDDNVQQ
ncbi:unnamed protein product [Closterium sp. NIES-53]